MALKSKYQELVKELKRISNLRSLEELLEYDERVFMPSNNTAHQFRGEQKSLISGLKHELQTSEKMGQILKELQSSEKCDSELNHVEITTIKLAKRDYERSKKLSKEIVEQEAKLCSEGYHIWGMAKKENNFTKFAPILEKWVTLRKQMAHMLDSSKNPYDVFLDEHERGLTQERVDEIFNVVQKNFVPMSRKIIQEIKKIENMGKTCALILESKEGKFDISTQQSLSMRVAKDIGYSFENGRLDQSVHPFTSSINCSDVRITTTFRNTEFLQGLEGTIHEVGHAIYEQNLNKEYEGTPVCQAVGMGVHESQSLLYERHVGLSLPFWKYCWPLVEESFPHLKKQNFDIMQVYRAVNQVKPIPIRIESDEVTYPMHILLRYEIEKGLFNGTIKVQELPTIWNQKMKEYLDIDISSDAEGVLQDIHWSGGSFGYFPTYLIGQIIAAQVFHKARQEVSNLDKDMENGKFDGLKLFLNQKIHSQGNLYKMDELIEKATGEPVNPQYFIDYIREKYSTMHCIKL